MRIIPMAVALGLALAGPALAASTSAKSGGRSKMRAGPRTIARNRRRCMGLIWAAPYTSSSPLRQEAGRNERLVLRPGRAV